jgi:hypothetical protein
VVSKDSHSEWGEYYMHGGHIGYASVGRITRRSNCSVEKGMERSGRVTMRPTV